MIYERTEVLKGFDGVEIFFRCFTPRRQNSKDTKLAGLVLGVHGFAEHSGRYADVAETVCSKQMAFAAFDLRGHGRSGPRRGDADDLHSIILDVLFVANHARTLLGMTARDENFFGILGVGFGALVATYGAAILQDFCPPLLLCSPLYGTQLARPAWKKGLGFALPSVLPTIPVPLGLKSNLMSENPINNSAYDADELNLSAVSARMARIYDEAVNSTSIRQSLSLIRAPMTFVCGTRDKYVDTAKVKEYVGAVHTERAQLSFVEGAGFDLFHEKDAERGEALRLLEKWIENKGKVT
jgi:acylglycerol lipase